MTIYHGGYQSVETPRIIEGEFAKDFGNGFIVQKSRNKLPDGQNAILLL